MLVRCLFAILVVALIVAAVPRAFAQETQASPEVSLALSLPEPGGPSPRGVALVSLHERERPRVGVRLGLEFLGALGGVAVGGAVFFGTLAIGLRGCDDPDSGDFCGLAALFGAGGLSAVTSVFTIPGGVSLAGDAIGVDGSYWAALAGSAGGAAVGVAIASYEPNAFTVLGVLPVLTIGGSILAYEASIDDNVSPPSAEESQRVRITPTIGAAGARDLMLGVSGRF